MGVGLSRLAGHTEIHAELTRRQGSAAIDRNHGASTSSVGFRRRGLRPIHVSAQGESGRHLGAHPDFCYSAMQQGEEACVVDRIVEPQIIEQHVGGWVIKRDTDNAPHRAGPEDITFLSRLLSEQGARSEAEAIEAVASALAGWLVQKARGERPSSLAEDDHLALIRLLPPVGMVEDGTADADLDTAALHPEADIGSGAAVEIPDEPEIQSAAVHTAPDASASRPSLTPVPLPRYDLLEGHDMARFHLDHGI